MAFVLAALRPLLVRLGLRTRWVVAAAALGLFTLVTRWEPSVLRAVVMAGVALTAWTLGRHVRPLRILALAVVVVVGLDPLIVHSLGFRLSVAATLALVTLAGPLARRLPGPRPVATALAVVLAAQAGTTPLLVAAGAGWSPVSVVANLGAVPVAGAVMMWGLTGGMVAGALGGTVASLLHLPTRAMLAWIDGTARWAGHPRWPEWPPVVIVAGTLTAVAALVAWHRGRRVAAGGAVVATLVVGSLAATTGPLRVGGPEALGRGAVMVRRGGESTLRLASGASTRVVLDGLVRRGCPGLVVAAAEGTQTSGVADAVVEFCGPLPIVVAESPG